MITPFRAARLLSIVLPLLAIFCLSPTSQAQIDPSQIKGLGNTVVVDGGKYALTAAGVQAAINAVQGSSCANGPGTVVMPAGKYAFGTGTIGTPVVLVSCNGIHIQGAGKRATEVDFTGPGIAFQFYSGGASVLYQDSIQGIFFNGAGDVGNTNQKIAIQKVDTSELLITDIDTLNWSGNSGSGTTPSIGIDDKGRSLTTVSRVSFTADRPYNLNLDPNISVSSDTLHIEDFYGIPLSTESCIVVVPGSVVQHWTMDGINVCAGGQHAILWSDTTAVSQVSQRIAIYNYHHEQSTSPSAYSFDFTRSNAGAQYIQNMTFVNVDPDISANGFKFQRSFNVKLINSHYASTTGVAVNADSTNFDTEIWGSYFQTGSTITNSSQHTGTDYNQFISFLMPEQAISSQQASGLASCYADSTAHAIQCSFNNGAFFPIPQVVVEGTATMTTSSIGNGACGTTVVASIVKGNVANVLGTDKIAWSYNAAPAANPGELTISAWPIAATSVNFQYCNGTGGSVTPNAATLNFIVFR